MKLLIVIKNEDYKTEKEFSFEVGEKIVISNSKNDNDLPELTYKYEGEDISKKIDISEDIREEIESTFTDNDEEGLKKFIVSRKEDALIEIIIESNGQNLFDMQLQLEKE